MSVALLDVNVLVALFDTAHADHQAAHRWLTSSRQSGWATCPLTINGCVRILSSPEYGVSGVSPAEVIARLERACSVPDHHCWPDSVSLTDESLFIPSMIRGHRTITDTYLLSLAVRNHGRLATFDTSIRIDAVRGARPSNLVVIGAR